MSSLGPYTHSQFLKIETLQNTAIAIIVRISNPIINNDDNNYNVLSIIHELSYYVISYHIIY